MSKLDKIVDDLSSLTVIEAAELAKKLEEKWGVSAAAPVAMAMAGGGAAAAQALNRRLQRTAVVRQRRDLGPRGAVVARRGDAFVPCDLEVGAAPGGRVARLVASAGSTASMPGSSANPCGLHGPACSLLLIAEERPGEPGAAYALHGVNCRRPASFQISIIRDAFCQLAEAAQTWSKTFPGGVFDAVGLCSILCRGGIAGAGSTKGP